MFFMSKIRSKVEDYALKTICQVENMMAEDRGDTNFLSIMIVLAIVLMLAVVFIGFKDQIVGKVSELISTFLEKLSI